MSHHLSITEAELSQEDGIKIDIELLFFPPHMQIFPIKRSLCGLGIQIDPI